LGWLKELFQLKCFSNHNRPLATKKNIECGNCFKSVEKGLDVPIVRTFVITHDIRSTPLYNHERKSGMIYADDFTLSNKVEEGC